MSGAYKIIEADRIVPSSPDGTVEIPSFTYTPTESSFSMTFINGPSTATSTATASGYLTRENDIVTVRFNGGSFTGAGETITMTAASEFTAPASNLYEYYAFYDDTDSEIENGNFTFSTAGVFTFFLDTNQSVFVNGTEYTMPPKVWQYSYGGSS